MSSDPVSQTLPEHDRSARRNVIAGMAFMVVLLAFLTWVALDTFQRTNERERVVNSVHLTAAVIATYVQEQRRWPSSVEDLASVGPVSVGEYTWPDDRDEVLPRVAVEYGVTLADVVKSTKDRFRAVRPADPEQESLATKNAFDRILPVARAVVDANPMMPE